MLRSVAVAAAERFGPWRIAQGLSTRPVLVGHPWHGHLLIYAGFAVVAHSSRKRLLELAPLRIGKQIRELRGTVHGLELTFCGVVGERLARTQTRRPALGMTQGPAIAVPDGAPIHRIGRFVMTTFSASGWSPASASIAVSHRSIRSNACASRADRYKPEANNQMIWLSWLLRLEARTHRPAVVGIVDLTLLVPRTSMMGTSRLFAR